MTITGGSLTGGAGGGGGTTDNVTDTHIPVKLAGAFEDSPLTWSGVPGENVISSETIEVPPGTIQVGEGMKMSAAGVIPIFRSLLTGIQYIPPLFVYDPEGDSGQPFKLQIDAPDTLVVQPDFSTSTPLTGTFTNVATSSEFITKLGIKTNASATLTNVRLQFVSQTTTEPIYYFPSKAGWNTDEGDDLTADGSGDVVIDLSEAPIGLLAGETIGVNYRIDSGVLLGTGTIPYQEVVRQVATFIDMLDIEDYKHRQLIRSGVKGDYTVSAITANTQIQLKTDGVGTEFEVYFSGGIDVDDRSGFSINVPDQVINVPVGPLDTTELYHIAVNSSGTIIVSQVKTDIDSISQVHLASFTAINGEVIPEGLIENPYLSYSDRTLQGIMESEGIIPRGFDVDGNVGALTLVSQAYTLISNGGNYFFSNTNPHNRDFPAQNPLAWTYSWTGIATPPTVGTDTLLDPTQWDNNGTLQAVGGGVQQSTVQAMLVTRTGQPVLLYGQQVFANYEDAVLNTRDVNFNLPAGLLDAVEVVRFAMRRDATDASDPDQVSIFPSLQGGGGSGQVPETTLFSDFDFELKNAGDDTKRAKFNLADIATATTNTYGLPEAGGTLAVERPIVNITGGTNITIDAPKYNQDTVYYISSPNNFTVFFSDEAAKANARITIIKASERRLTFESLGAVTINGATAGTQFDQFKEHQVFNFVQSDITTGKTWTFDPGDREQSIAYCKFNPQGIAVGQEVDYRNKGRGFRVFKVAAGQFRVENDGTILNDLRETWATQGASGNRGVFEIDFFIFGIAGHTVNIYTWSSGNGAVTGEPGTVNIEVTNSAGGNQDVTNANGHIYFEYKETI